jgi:hypothetical protein
MYLLPLCSSDLLVTILFESLLLNNHGLFHSFDSSFPAYWWKAMFSEWFRIYIFHKLESISSFEISVGKMGVSLSIP